MFHVHVHIFKQRNDTIYFKKLSCIICLWGDVQQIKPWKEGEVNSFEGFFWATLFVNLGVCVLLGLTLVVSSFSSDEPMELCLESHWSTHSQNKVCNGY